MSVITLTDRISVSVRAKNNTEKSAQNKATGANIQRALGGSDLSDSDLEEIGNVNSIQDEQGNEWIKMEDIIAAGRKMKEKGAFKDKKSYRYGNVACVPLESFGNCPVTGVESYHGPIWDEKKGNTVSHVYKNNTGMAAVVRLNSTGTLYYLGPNGSEFGVYYPPNEPVGWGSTGTNNKSSIPNAINIRLPITEVGTLLSLAQYGDYHEETSGGSLIDWDAPNAEVERQIKNLHETWDVSDHPGAVTGNGTYVLAGPIEFNDGD